MHLDGKLDTDGPTHVVAYSVTGISGYLGVTLWTSLSTKGTATVRSSKVALHTAAFKVYGAAVEVVGVDDLVKGSFTDILKDVNAVIHQAAPLPGRSASLAEALDISVQGSLNLLVQAEKAGIKNFSYAGSAITYTNDFALDRGPLDEDDWLPITREGVLSIKEPDAGLIYAAEKVLAERAVWEFADQHPHVELTSVGPTYFFGPFAPGHKAPFEGETFNKDFFKSSMAFLWRLLQPKNPVPPPDHFVDVRDVARALVAGIQAPPASQVGRKRILLSSPRPQPSELIALITKHRPELVPRLNEAYKARPDGVTQFIENKRAKEILKLEIIPWEKTILDAVDALVQLEDTWKGRGKPIVFE
ncbi:hypothetical protein EIP91_001390 [Steccherinum ochraceum]|uniref:NAD-dependent epimerase/dehydratase domain-containing protein n=1 Tax=Steccherinum ochraceum TaxID=92696 RepID=A0A4R0RMI7_9APHY|nr:hypothetical protein EIP91_001390 [Steccherinum ochraceum]